MNLSKISLTCCSNSNTHTHGIYTACDGNIEPTQYYIETIMDAHIYILLIMNDKVTQNTSKRGKGNNYTKFITFLYRNYIEC